MRIFLLTFYYPPDLAAGSFRAKALVDALLECKIPELHVEILTTMPNRYRSHQSEAKTVEESSGVTIRRFRLPPHESGMYDQGKAFLSYAISVTRAIKGRSCDLIIATSSRLMTASLGALIARSCDAPLYLDIRDLFSDTMSDLFKDRSAIHILPLIRLLEKFTFNNCQRLAVVSEGFLPHINAVAPLQKVKVFTNGIDEEFLNRSYSKTSANDNALPLILYAGNIGEGQGLHRIIPTVAIRLNGIATIRIIGDGGRRRHLERELARLGVTNVELFGALPRRLLLDHYRQADILFLHLNDQNAFKKVLPSKIFEYAATGKPIIAGVAGYAAKFLRSEVPGVQVFDPCDVEAMLKSFLYIKNQNSTINRDSFRRKYARAEIMRAMAQDVIKMIPDASKVVAV